MNANELKEALKKVKLDTILMVWEWTRTAENKEVPAIRGAIMDELERRNPQGFNAWLDSDAPKDEDLPLYMRSTPYA